VAGTAVPVAVAASALDTNPRSIMSAGQKLVTAGRLVETEEGYKLADGTQVDVSPTVAAYLSGRLADSLLKKNGDRMVAGRLLITAGRPAEAWEVLGAVALDDSVKRSDSDQLHLLDLALYALDRAQLSGGSVAAEIRVRLARLSRARGDTDAAREAISLALPHLAGVHLVDGLGFAAAIADDLQLPQEAERWVALAAMSAAEHGLMSKLGSLLTFHGRELSRLGFAEEAQAAIAKGNALLESHGSEVQRFYAALNQAWVDLDQGQMRKAEAGFARLREQARRMEGEASEADKDAYWARALFGTGRPDLALEAISRALELAGQIGAAAPEFIAAMAQAEGGVLYEQWAYAEQGAHKVVELSDSALTSWKNVGFYLAARALAGTGQVEAARSALTAALGATPEGSNGIRWRTRIDALLLALADTWDTRRAVDLTDLLLQSQWFGAAVELMITRATRDRDPRIASEAAALAMEIGNPALAAQAIRAGKLWNDPIARPVASALLTIQSHLPEGWEFMSDAAALPAVAAAAEPTAEDAALLRARIEDALGAAGLASEVVLSPAQRRAAGQVRRRRRPLSPLRLVAGAVGVVAIAVVSALAVINRTPEPPPITTASTAAPTTAAPVLEETLIPVPADGLSGSVAFRSDPGRTGVASGGFRQVLGRYWQPLSPGGSFVTAPVAFGRYVFVASDEDIVYGVEQRNGRIVLVIPTNARVVSPLAVGRPTGDTPPVLAFGGADGSLYAHSALDGLQLWTFDLGSVLRSAPLIVGDSMYVATSSGQIFAFDLAGGELLWQYPAESPTGSFRSTPAFADDVIYAVTAEGMMHLVGATDGLPRCEPFDLNFEVATNPVVTGGAVFVGLDVGGVSTFGAGTCGIPAEGYSIAYPVARPVRLSPAIVPDRMFYTEDRLLLSIFLDSSLWVDTGVTLPSPWPEPFSNDELITTPPVFADEVIYFGTQDGRVQAVDAASGEGLWEFRTGAAIRGEPLVVPGAVFVGNARGELWAIAGQ
jgi:outer membrane protein assembly factor BamB/tetratricopeptide (TPR) repeat protein